MAAPLPTDELRRLRALRDLRVLDTPEEPAFDDLAQLAAHVCGTPAAVFTLVDESRQWFKARVGLQVRETHRDASFCAHTITGEDMLVVTDAAKDERFADNPLVIGEPHIRFYAGAPLIDRHGNALGSLAAIDFVPRTVSDEQLSLLRKLARQATAQLELRQLLEDQKAAAQQAVELEKRHARERAETEVARIFSLSDDLICLATTKGYFRKVNPAFERVLGYPPHELYAMPIAELVHPEDRAATRAELGRLAAGFDSRSFTNRCRTRSGEWRWLEWNSVIAPENGTVYAVGRDVTETRRLQQQSASERDVLEALAQGAPLADALHLLLQALERDFPDVGGAILECEPEADRLRPLAIGRLSPDLAAALVELPPRSGCRVEAPASLAVIEDLEAAPVAKDLAARVTGQGWRACWSLPIRAAAGGVLGRLVALHRRPRQPDREERASLRRAAHLAGLAMERHRLFETLRQSETNLQAAQEQARLGSWEHHLQTGYRWWSLQMYRLFGLAPEAGPPTFEAFLQLLEREDQARMVQSQVGAVEQVDPVQISFLTRSGQTFSAVIRCVRDAEGNAEKLVGTVVDVTEQTRAQEAVRVSEERFRQLAENVREVFWIRDAKSEELLYVSPAYLSTWGRSVSSLRKSPRQWMEAVHPEDQPRVRAAVEQRIRAGTYDEHYRILQPDGSVRWIHDRAFPIEDANGDVYRVVGVADDVTEQMEIERALREHERRQATLIENLPGVSYRCRNDEHWTAEFVSAVFTQLTGHPAEDAINGRVSFLELIHPEDRAAVREAVDRALARRQRYQVDYRLRRADGRERWVREYGCGVFDESGQLEALEGFLQDITEQREADEALRQSEFRLRTLVEEARDAVVQLTPDLRIESLNAAFETITGWPRQRWLGRPFAEVVHEADRPKAGGLFERVMRGDKMVPFELRLQQPNHQHVTLEFTAAPEYAAGELSGVMAIGRDLTARNQLEEQLHQAQRMESIGQLAGGVAHDFNNILAVILMQSSLIETLENPTPAIAEGLQQIKLAAERAAGLTRQLLTFSRRQHMQLRDVDLSQVVDNLGKMLRRILGEDIELHTSSAGELPLVHADVGMIEQVVMNLVVNARDAMPRGGKLTITTEVDDTPAHGTGSPFEPLKQRAVVLTVTDTGTGIAPEVLPRIFEPFYTTKEVGKGTGLGLATVYGIVRQHGGVVDVESEVGRGSRFRVLLPAVTRTAEEAGKAVPPAELRGGNETILVVEDEAVVRALVRLVLEQKGYRVIEAMTGAAAVVQWEQGLSFDLLLTDMVMPGGVSGQELAQLMQARRPDLPVIYTSGYSADAVAQGFPLREGVNFLQKPFGPIKLLTAVRAALDAAQATSG